MITLSVRWDCSYAKKRRGDKNPHTVLQNMNGYPSVEAPSYDPLPARGIIYISCFRWRFDPRNMG